MAAKTTTTVTQARVRDRWFNTSSCGTLIFGASLTKQEFKDECDINHILARLQDGPPKPWASPPSLRYGDFAAAPDFLAAQLLVKAAEEQFLSIRADLRERFNHDPATFLRFLHDPANRDEARKLGFLKPAVPAPPPAPPAEPPK